MDSHLFADDPAVGLGSAGRLSCLVWDHPCRRGHLANARTGWPQMAGSGVQLWVGVPQAPPYGLSLRTAQTV